MDVGVNEHDSHSRMHFLITCMNHFTLSRTCHFHIIELSSEVLLCVSICIIFYIIIINIKVMYTNDVSIA